MELTNWKLHQTIIGNNTLIASSANLKTILSINITNNAETTQVISLYVQNGGIDYYIFKDLELYSKETLHTSSIYFIFEIILLGTKLSNSSLVRRCLPL